MSAKPILKRHKVTVETEHNAVAQSLIISPDEK